MLRSPRVPRATADSTGGRADPRGPVRRQALVDATVRVLGAEGPHGVSHRSVAREAGLPLAATTYYFSSKDELLQEALRVAAEHEIARLQERAAELGSAFSSSNALGRALASVLADQVRRERGSLLVKFDVYLQAARRPPLRPAARHWIEAFTGLADGALAAAGVARPREAAELLVAGADGLLIHHLATRGRTASTDELENRLERLVASLIAAGDASR